MATLLPFAGKTETLGYRMVTLQVLLKKDHRSSESVQLARAALQQAGLNPISSGAATVVVDASPETFASLFGPGASAALAERRSGKDISLPDLPVPAALAEFVESISIAPKHLYLQRPPEGHKLS